VVQSNPGLSIAHFNRAVVRQQLGQSAAMVLPDLEVCRGDPSLGEQVVGHIAVIQCSQSCYRAALSDLQTLTRQHIEATPNLHAALIIALMETGDLEGAVHEAEQAHQLHPLHLNIMVARADALVALGSQQWSLGVSSAQDFLVKGRRVYCKVLHIDPTLFEARLHLARSYQLEADHPSSRDTVPQSKCSELQRLRIAEAHIPAWRALSGALAVQPSSVTALEARAVSLLACGNMQGALQDCSRALQNVPKGCAAASLHTTRALVYEAMRDYKEAKQDLEDALAEEPSAEYARFVQGCISMQSKSWKDAEGHFSRCLAENPHHASARLNRGVSYYMLCQLSKAEEDFSAVIELCPQDYNAIFNRAVVRNRLGNIHAANQDCDEVVEMLPRDARARLLRMDLRRRHHDTANHIKQALEDFRLALQLDEDLATTRLNL